MFSLRIMWWLVLMAPLVHAHQFKLKSEANPMRKIISMLQDMAKELEREGELEKELFEKALCACETGDKELQKTIDDASASVEEYSSKVKAETAENAGLSQEVTEAKAAVEQATKDLATATALREKESKAFAAKEKSTKLNIDNLGKAIPAVAAGMGGAALLQTHSLPKFNRFLEVTRLLTAQERSKVLSFLDQGENNGAEAPQSGEILGILKHLKDTMEAELSDAQSEEQQAHSGYTELKNAKSDEISVTSSAIVAKEKRMGTLALSLSQGKHALSDSERELANAQKFKANMAEECATKMKERDERAKMRSAEIAAVSDAVKILNDDDALETFAKQKSSLVQQPKKTYEALLQFTLKNGASRRSLLTIKRQMPDIPDGLMDPVATTAAPTGPPPTPRPIQLGAAVICEENGECKDLRTEGTEAQKLVTHMVDGMVSVLHDEDVDDEHKKEWCYNETQITAKIHGEKKELSDTTRSEISETKDHIATIVAEIEDLNAKINELDKLVHETTVQRTDEHQEFVDGFATTATAIRLIDKAITRLHKFYFPQKHAKEVKEVKDAAVQKAGLALVNQNSKAVKTLLNDADFDAFVQIKEHATTFQIPETPGTYEKKESGGVLGLMDEFKTDLKTDMVEAETEEKNAAKDYVRVMADAKASRDQDVKSLNGKKSAKAHLEDKLVMKKELLIKTEDELHNIELYQVQLHSECDFLLRNYDSRHEGRVESEVGLSEAETIVSGQAHPPDYQAVEQRFEDEHSDTDVDQNFPGTPVSDIQPAPAPKKEPEGLGSLLK